MASDLVEHLQHIRNRYIEHGGTLLSEDEIAAEVLQRRGGAEHHEREVIDVTDDTSGRET